MGYTVFNTGVHFAIYLFEFIISYFLYNVLWERKNFPCAVVVLTVISFSGVLTALNATQENYVIRILSIAITLFIFARVLFISGMGSQIYTVTILVTTGILSEGIAELMRTAIFHINTPPADEYNLYQVITSIIGKMIWFSFIQMLIHFKYSSKQWRSSGKIAIILFPTVLTFCMYQMISLNVAYGMPVANMFQIIFIGIAGLGSCLIIDRIYDYSRERYELANRLAEQQANASYYDAVKKNDELLLRQQHEYKNTIMTFSRMVCDECRPSIAPIMGDLVDSVDRSKQLLVTADFRNKVVNSIINYHMDLCTRHEIHLEMEICHYDLSFLQPIDTGVLLNNAFTNAVEACTALDCSMDRWIKFKIRKINNEVVIGIQNPKKTEVRINQKNIRSTKANALIGGHGFGIKNMMERAALYGGTVLINDEGDVFSLTIRLTCEEK